MHLNKNANIDEWWDIAQSSPYATFFHTPIWHQLACKNNPELSNSCFLGETRSGSRFILPLLQTPSRFHYNLTSTYAGCYGGPVSQSPLPIDELTALYKNIIQQGVGQFILTGNPLAQAQQLSLPNTAVIQDFTHILTLDQDYQTLFSNFKKGHKSSIKKGLKLGVTIRKATSLADFKAYFEAYQDSIKRWGDNATSIYPWDFFKAGFELSQEHPENMILWLAEHGEKVLGGSWVFYWNSHASYWHGASYADSFNYCPNNVLQGHIIEDAIQRGYLYYDFLPSGGHEGVAKFKSNFGAKKWHFNRYTYRSRLVKYSQLVQSKLR